ncbi:MAG: NAD-dependent epimerase/dehydratase family protein [Asgard group archaeon]|nr:NAD-dependent epimerase/dehydratase family protein [Asgard group archaeon]
MSKVFVTGATGQVGSHVVKYIISEKKLGIETPKDVLCLVRNPDIASELQELGVTFVKGDLQDSDIIVQTMKNGVDYVFHIAANCLLNQTYEQMYVPNVLGTRIILDAFVKSQAKVLVYTSSIAVYSGFLGKESEYLIDEQCEFGPLEGEPYPVTKRISENIIQEYTRDYPEKKFIITRLGAIIGAGDKQFIPTLVDIMSYTFIPKMVNRGKDLVSITSPYDVARAQVFLAILEKDISGEAYNVANESISYRGMVNTIAEYYSRRYPKLSIKYWFFKIMRPFLMFLEKIFPNVKLIKMALSPVAMDYIGKSYHYKSDKIKELGFEFTITPKETIIACLEHMDPEKKRLKPSKYLFKRRAHAKAKRGVKSNN